MARNKAIDYSQEIPDIAAPVAPNYDAGTAGRTRGAAAELEGKGKGLAAQADGVSAGAALAQQGAAAARDGNWISFLGQHGLAAVKGYGEAEVAKETTKALDMLLTPDYAGPGIKKQMEANMPNAQAANIAANSLEERYTSPDFAGDAVGMAKEIKDFRAEAQRYADAATQGAISKQQAINMIAAKVKEWSANVPGFASDFRKTAAELTGISHIDSFAVHKALTEQGVMEKQQAAIQAANLSLLKDVAQWRGYTSLEQVGPADRLMYQQHKALEAAKVQSEANQSILKAGREQRTIAFGQEATVSIANFANNMQMSFRKVLEANGIALNSGTSVTDAQAEKVGGLFLATMQEEYGKVRNGLQVRSAQLGLTPEETKGHLDGLEKQMAQWTSQMTTARGFNMFKTLVANSEGDVKKLLADMDIANPFLAVSRHNGWGSKLFEKWGELKGPDGKGDAFKKAYGDEAWKAMSHLMSTNFAVYPRLMGQFQNGQLTLEQIAATNPDVAAALKADVGMTLKTEIASGKKLNTPESKATAAIMFQTVGKAANPANIKQFGETLDLFTSKEGQAMLNQLDPTMRTQAVAPVLKNIDSRIPRTTEVLREAVDRFNTAAAHVDPELKGMKASIITTSAGLELVIEGRTRDMTTMTQREKNTALPTALVGYGSTPTGVRELEAAVKPHLNWLNMVPAALVTLMPMTNAMDVKDLNAPAIYRQIESNISRRSDATSLLGGKIESLLVPSMPTTTNPQGTGPAVERANQLLGALIEQESGGKHESAPGTLTRNPTSGALGITQVMPKTATDPGFGVTPLRDNTEAEYRRFGRDYLAAMLDKFGNDQMALAAYNYGPGAVETALRKAKASGVPDQWLAFTPDETRKYVTNIMARTQRN